MGSVIGMQVIGVPGYLQFSEDLRVFRFCKVDHKEGVDPLEGHHIETVTDEPCRIDRFLFGNMG